MRTKSTSLLAAAALLTGGCSAMTRSADPSTDSTSRPAETPDESVTGLQQAANDCERGHLVKDEGLSITLDTKGSEEGNDQIYDEITDVACLLTELDAPDYVTQHVDSTRALDGQQTDEWGTYEARWTYHPDDGLQITFIDRS